MAETATLKVGDEAPDFELRSSPLGETFKLSDHKGTNAVVINFVPAAFSPACSTQLPLIEQKRGEFESQGAIPVAISADNAWSLKAWKEQTGVNYPVLSDFNPHGAVAKAYGVFIEQAGSRTAWLWWWTSRARWPGSSHRRRSRRCPTTTRCWPATKAESKHRFEAAGSLVSRRRAACAKRTLDHRSLCEPR
jgi:peroxiredoxin